MSLQNDQNAMNMQINHQNVTSYGATEHVTGNPFATANTGTVAGNPFASTMLAEPVQPYPTDSYMHGNANDRDLTNQYPTNY